MCDIYGSLWHASYGKKGPNQCQKCSNNDIDILALVLFIIIPIYLLISTLSIIYNGTRFIFVRILKAGHFINLGTTGQVGRPSTYMKIIIHYI